MKLLRQQNKFVAVDFCLVLCPDSPAARSQSIAFDLRFHLFPRSKRCWNVSQDFRIYHCTTISDKNHFFSASKQAQAAEISIMYFHFTDCKCYLHEINKPSKSPLFLTKVTPSFLISAVKSSAMPNCWTSEQYPFPRDSGSRSRKDQAKRPFQLPWELYYESLGIMNGCYYYSYFNFFVNWARLL